MIRSMTGFCKTEVIHQDINCSVEIRSVNHRYLEARMHLPKQFQYFEESLKRTLKKKVHRGKVDVFFQLDTINGEEEKLSVNSEIWSNVKSIVTMLEKDVGHTIQLSLTDLLQIKGLLAYEQEDLDVGEYEALFEKAVEKAAAELTTMREREGALLAEGIEEHIAALESLVKKLPEFRQDVINAYKQKLEKNLQLLQVPLDENDARISQEIGLFIDKSDVTEEIERINTHLVQFRELIASNEPVGRKLDFILQELFREANTLCSKANHIQVTQIGVEMKSEIEKIREQVQNIE